MEKQPAESPNTENKPAKLDAITLTFFEQAITWTLSLFGSLVVSGMPFAIYGAATTGFFPALITFAFGMFGVVGLCGGLAASLLWTIFSKLKLPPAVALILAISSSICAGLMFHVYADMYVCSAVFYEKRSWIVGLFICCVIPGLIGGIVALLALPLQARLLRKKMIKPADHKTRVETGGDT